MMGGYEVLIFFIVSIIAVFGIDLLKKYLSKSKYDEKSNRAILEDIRNSLENKIYNINDRLVQSEERWRDVNHLLIRKEYTSNSSPLGNSEKTHYSEFLKANGIVKNDLLVDKRLIFVLTPFNDKYIEDFKVLRGVCSSNGYECIRGDERNFKGDIFPHVLRFILKANIIIANLNGRSPNVLYELGVAQALNKSVILIATEPDDLPVDIKSQRFLIYSSYAELESMVRKELFNLNSLNE